MSDVFKGELDEVNGKLATSDRMLSHMQRYMDKIESELQVSSPHLAASVASWHRRGESMACSCGMQLRACFSPNGIYSPPQL